MTKKSFMTATFLLDQSFRQLLTMVSLRFAKNLLQVLPIMFIFQNTNFFQKLQKQGQHSYRRVMFLSLLLLVQSFLDQIQEMKRFHNLFTLIMTDAYMMGEEKQTAIQMHDNDVLVIPPGVNPQQIVIIRPEDGPSNAITAGLVKPTHPETILQQLEGESLQNNARIQFIRKVFSLLTIMLTITFGMCFVSFYSPTFQEFQVKNFWAFYMFAGIAAALIIVMQFCCRGQDGLNCSGPITLVLLLVFTICYSYMVSFCTSIYANVYGAPLILEAMGSTILLVTALIIYTFAIKTDFHTLTAIIIVGVLGFILFGISFAFTMSSVLHTLYCTFGVIVGGIIFIIDLQMIADGQRGCSLDNPVLGALILYIDIMRIFLYILMAMGKKK